MYPTNEANSDYYNEFQNFFYYKYFKLKEANASFNL